MFFQCIPFIRIIEPLTHSTEGSCLNTLVPNVVPPSLVRLPFFPPIHPPKTKLLTRLQTIAVDLYVLLLPVHTIATIRASNSRKAGILCIVCFGLASLSLSAVRLPFVLQMTDALGTMSTTYDMSYNVAKMIILVALEMQFASIAANLPAVAGLYNYYARRQRSTAAGGGADSSGTSGLDAKPISLEVFGRRQGSREKAGVPMGTVTRLERDVASLDEEEEGLVGRDDSVAPPSESRGRESEQDLSRIEVTTHVDVVTNPRSGAWGGYPGGYVVSSAGERR